MYVCYHSCSNRPENTHKTLEAVRQADLNLLYWSSEETLVEASQMCGKCEVVCGEDLDEDKDDWFIAQSDRFYFYEAYNSKTKMFEDPPHHARSGRSGSKGKVGWDTLLTSTLMNKCCAM